MVQSPSSPPLLIIVTSYSDLSDASVLGISAGISAGIALLGFLIAYIYTSWYKGDTTVVVGLKAAGVTVAASQKTLSDIKGIEQLSITDQAQRFFVAQTRPSNAVQPTLTQQAQNLQTIQLQSATAAPVLPVPASQLAIRPPPLAAQGQPGTADPPNSQPGNPISNFFSSLQGQPPPLASTSATSVSARHQTFAAPMASKPRKPPLEVQRP